MEKKIQQIIPIFKKYPSIKLAYLFGSQASGEAGSLSDYDFAVYLKEDDKQKMYGIKFKLMDEISRMLKVREVDVVILNNTESPELKYEIIKDGRLIYEEEPYRVLIEPKILREFFDFQIMLRKYNLTKT
jgi:uncharacterized protein